MERLFYLGQLAPLQADGQETDSNYIIMMPGSSPKAMTDTAGRFAFLDVDPDTYVVVYWTPNDSWVLRDPDTQEQIVVTIEADKVTDLGSIRIKTTR
jgi:hypothetical protein